MGKCFGLLLFIMSCGGVIAQPFPSLQFNHITTSNGLSSNTATCVTEDKRGFIWIGTDNGLNRWDGYRIKQYFHNEADPHSLVLNRVQSLHCDSKDRIWITTDGGVSCFLPDENIFINYSVNHPPPHRLKNNTAIRVTEEKDGAIWITNQQDVIYRVQDDMSLLPLQIQLPSFAFENIRKAGYDGMMPDSRGNEWAFCANRIYVLDPRTRQPLQTFDFSRQLGHASISSMREDGHGGFWVATWGSVLWQFSPSRQQLMPVKQIPALDVLEWSWRDSQWMVAFGLYSGIYFFQEGDDSLKKLEWNPADTYSLTGTAFYSLYTDRRRNLWICTNNGVNYVQTARKIFDIQPVTNPGTADYDRATTEVPYSYFEDGDDVWLSKRYKATFLYDSAMRVKKCYTSLYPLSTTVTRWRGNAYYFFRRGACLYISTDSGIVRYDAAHSTSRLYFPPASPGKGIEGDMRTIVPLDSSRILIRTVNEGLFIFNTVTKTFVRHITHHDSAAKVLAPTLNYLLKTAKGDVFISGDPDNSLVRYDAATDVFSAVQPSNENAVHLLSNRIFGMAEDRQGRLWLASSNGIYIYNVTKNIVEGHFTGEGKMGSLFRICFDRYGNAWVNGNSGIWCHIAAKDKWINFNAQDGLPGSDFEGIIACRANGDIVAGVQGALAIFHPGQLYAPGCEPPTVITEASAGDRPILFPLMKKAIKKLDLPSDQNSFSVDYAVLNYYEASSIQYLYRLEPLMNAFEANSNGHINFYGLMPGHYTLHVKGAGKAGDVYIKEDSMEIDIAPHWYQSWPFRATALLVLATLITLLVKRRISNIRNESALKQRIIETEMQALRAQMDPHFIFNCLSSIENFIMKNEKRLASDYLNKFARLIRMILDSSRNELVPLQKDMEALQLYVDLEQISCNNKFLYTTLIDPELLREDYHVPPLLLQPYVENAIVHGLMPSRGTDLTLAIRIRLESGCIRYIVEDNGIGREQAIQYRLRNRPGHESLGMRITEERISIFNRRTRSKGSVAITDLYDNEHNPRGTRVEITIKAM